MAPDLRSRLDLAHQMTWRDPGFVWPMDPRALLIAAYSLWILGWTLATARALRESRGGNAGSIAALLAAAAAGAGAVLLAGHLEGRSLSVVRDASPLREDPRPGSRIGITVLQGEVVKLRGETGGWSRVQLADGRAGWIPATALSHIALSPTVE
jgi:hypothetical protein